jgi:hypothetical protein
MSDQTQGEISVNIDRLILDGIDLAPEQHGAFRAALAAELSRLLGEGGLDGGLAAGGAYYAARAGEIKLAEPASPAALGAQVARSVYGGIGG